MINPDYLLNLWRAHESALTAPVRIVRLPRHRLTFEDRAYQMGVINLSKDSSYRESICLSVNQARYRARRMQLEGAALVDIGAESTGVTAARVSAAQQGDLLWPVIDNLHELGIPLSVETYYPEVAEVALAKGAAVINLTGRNDDEAIFRLVARHDAGLILCYTAGQDARDHAGLPSRDELIEMQMEFFRSQLTRAERYGLERIWIDPGVGFYNNLPDGRARVAFQIENVLQGFRFRELGWPICLTLPSPVAMFKEEVRSAETCFAVLAVLSKANIVRSHEVARVQPVLDWQKSKLGN